jgi:biotin synthase
MNTQTIAFHHPAKRPTTQKCWGVDEVEALFRLPFADLLYRAQQVHREHFDPNAVQLSTLLSVKTGGCSEDCGYCPQSSLYSTDVEDRMWWWRLPVPHS